MLKYIGNLIARGFTSGYYPYWRLFLTNVCHDELSELTLKHISESVADGYIEGEIVENHPNYVYTGWWRLQI
ncbi:MAG: hypothetical protein US18_C0010G0001 [Parcubacteria group bacterium GW2011_GWB1_36_5]|nr:MAG: hypothetical protein US18_C0010G0001 [Parcubacteria group bacterium GW2011_GWB1_36_5]